MKTPFQMVNRNLDRTARTWRWLRLIQHGSTLGVIVVLYFLWLALAMLEGWVAHPEAARVFVAGGFAAGGLVGLGVVGWVLSRKLHREWLAQQVERGHPGLLDRVNTLVALERSEAHPEASPFYQRIGRQAQALLGRRPTGNPHSARRALVHFIIFLAVLLATMEVYDRYAPWERLTSTHRVLPVVSPPAPPEPTLELPPPPDSAEKTQPWGEVRITEPAKDLQVTKVDVVPLQIEAAANTALQDVGWISAINGQTQQVHPLPPPDHPQQAVYSVLLYLDEFNLSDWDVMAYYARATTEGGILCASDVYFIEVRPFREDILKTPGGENGRAMQSLNALSTLIRSQQEVVRQTHRHVQSPPESPKLEARDRNKLADAEADLQKGAKHLYARMAKEMENQPIGEALDHLAQAETALDQAADSLRNERTSAAQDQERSALADLVAARKAFQKSISEDPGDFEEEQPEKPPLAGSGDVLKSIADFRNEQKAAQDFMQELVKQQTALARSLTNESPATLPEKAEEQSRIQQSLEEFQQQHPRAFQPAEPEADAAKQSLRQATQSLQEGASSAPTQVQEAAGQLEKLAGKMQDRSLGQQLADADKLKQMLDRQIETFARCESPGKFSSPSAGELKKTMADTRQTLKELNHLAAQEPAKKFFGPALGGAVNEIKQLSLEWAMSDLEEALPSGARQEAAGQLKDGLAEVSRAFEASLPQAPQASPPNGAGESPAGGFERGLAQLDSLIKQLENQRPISGDDQQKQANEALRNLQSAREDLKQGKESGERTLERAEAMLSPEQELPKVELLNQLLGELQTLAVEAAAGRNRKLDQPGMTAGDPNRLPPAYRGRIERYFQKLSEP